MMRSILFSARLSTEWDRLRHSGQCSEPFWAAVRWMQDVQKLCWHLSDTGLVISSKHMAHWSSSDTDALARESACMGEDETDPALSWEESARHPASSLSLSLSLLLPQTVRTRACHMNRQRHSRFCLSGVEWRCVVSSEIQISRPRV